MNANKEIGSFKYRTEHYYGSKRNIHTVSWQGRGEIDTNEVRAWLVENFGAAGYQEDSEKTRWVDNTESGEIMLCDDADLTFFLLRWT